MRLAHSRLFYDIWKIFSTHYVVLGYELELNIELTSLPDEQHNHYQWWEVENLLTSEQVHGNTKAYFSDTYK